MLIKFAYVKYLKAKSHRSGFKEMSLLQGAEQSNLTGGYSPRVCVVTHNRVHIP